MSFVSSGSMTIINVLGAKIKSKISVFLKVVGKNNCQPVQMPFASLNIQGVNGLACIMLVVFFGVGLFLFLFLFSMRNGALSSLLPSLFATAKARNIKI